MEQWLHIYSISNARNLAVTVLWDTGFPNITLESAAANTDTQQRVN